MPRGLSIYNGQNDEIEEASAVPTTAEEKLGLLGVVGVGVGGVTTVTSSLAKVTSSSPMTASEKAGNRIAMAVEFDHMYLGCSESKASIGKDIEVQHLKDLLLLHLDLIQQQAEQLVAKDKLIKSLRDENENLKSRLDRIDRRVSLSLSKKSCESSSHEVKLDVSAEEGQSDVHPKRLGSPTSKVEAFHSTKNLSPPNKNASCSKSLSPSNKLASPSGKAGSPSSKASSPSGKAVSPSSKPGSPPSKHNSSSSKPGSPSSKPCSPSSKPGSPVNKSTPNKQNASSMSKIESPSSKPISPTASKLQTPNNKASPLSRKSVSPQARVGSPPGKVISPNSKSSPSASKSPSLSVKTGASSPSSKPSSPQPKPAQSPQDDDEDPACKVGSPCSVIESSSNKGSSSSKHNRRPSRMPSKALIREKRKRNASQGQSSENDADIEPLKESSKGIGEKERSRLKRRSDSETEASPIKRIRPDRDRSSGHVKDDGLTDHNLRSRDKSRDRVRTSSKSEDLSEFPIVRPLTPTPRAAALEAKKLRQKLQLKGKTPAGASVRADGILNTCVSYFLPYGAVIQDPNPEEECLQAQVEIPRWGTRILTSLYVMEGTENLEDEIFIKRHAKPEQDEKRRKRWDLQRMREQRHYERLRERYESRQSANEPTLLGDGSLWPHPESAMYLHVEDTLPVCAFGQPLARIPPQEFTIPWLSGQSFEGVTTRRRKR